MKSLSCNEKCLQHAACETLEKEAGIRLNKTELRQLANKCGKDSEHKIYCLRLELVKKIKIEDVYPPAIVHQLCTHLRKHMDVVGLFRISGSQKRIATLKDKLENEPHELTDENPHDVANLLTLFFRQLPILLFPNLFCDSVSSIMNIENKNLQLKTAQLLCLVLPRAHLHCLIYTCHFLWELSQHSSNNRMTVTSIATVFVPNFFEVDIFNDMNQNVEAIMKQQTSFIKLLIENQNLLGQFPDPALEEIVCFNVCIHQNAKDDCKHKRRSFAERMKNSMCGKLLKFHSNNPSDSHTDVSAYKKIGLKRTADLDEACPAKRRSLQGSALEPEEIEVHLTHPKPNVPEIAIVSFEVQENMHKPNINFCEEASSNSLKLAPKQQRHDSGSTSCFHSIKMNTKPKTRRSFHNFRKHKNCEEVIVHYPVDGRSDLLGQKLANHTFTSHSDLNHKRKKEKHFLSKLKLPFASPAARRKIGTPSNKSACSQKDLQQSKDSCFNQTSVTNFESNMSVASSTDQTLESSCATSQSTQSVESIFHGLDPSSEEVINESVCIFDLSLNTLISMNKPIAEEITSDKSLNVSDISSIKANSSVHDNNDCLGTSLEDDITDDFVSNTKENSTGSSKSENVDEDHVTSDKDISNRFDDSVENENNNSIYLHTTPLSPEKHEDQTKDYLKTTETKQTGNQDILNNKTNDIILHQDCLSILNTIIEQIVDTEKLMKMKNPRCVLNNGNRIRNYSSPLKRSRVLSRHSGLFVLEERGIIRGKILPAKKRQRIFKRLNSPGREGSCLVKSVATKSKLRQNVLNSGDQILPNKIKLFSRTFGQNQGFESGDSKVDHLPKPRVLKDLVRPSPLYASQRIYQFEQRVAENAKFCKTRHVKTIKSGLVSEVVEKFNSLSGNKPDGRKLPPLPYKLTLPDSSPVSPYTLSKSLNDNLESPSPHRRGNTPDKEGFLKKSKSVEFLDKGETKQKVRVGTPRKPKLAPLVLMNLFADDELDNSPVKRATPKQPRSRDPIKPL